MLAAIFALAGSTAWAEEIKIGGTGNALGTIGLLADAFKKKNPDIKVTLLTSLGSSGAIKAVPTGTLDLGVSSRNLSDQERAGGMVATEYARTITVFAVSTKSKVTEITNDQIADIYSGKLAAWPDGTPTRPVLRQPGDDNTKQIKTLSPAIEKALIAAELRPGLPFAVTDQEAADKIESIPGSVGVTTLALIKSEKRALRPLKLDNMEANESNGAAGSYPLIKHFYFITKAAPPTGAEKFMAFVSSPAGKAILKKTGHWPP